MIILSSSDVLRVVLAGAVTTNQPMLFASYLDVADDSSTAAAGNTDGTTNSTTPVNWVGSPSSGKRQVKYASLHNADTVSVVATVSVYDGANARSTIKATLLTGETLIYETGVGWRIFTADGDLRSSVATVEAGQHAVWIAAGSMTPSASGGCASLATISSAANQPDIQTLDFDATTAEYAQFSIKMPSSWNEGTVSFRPVWSHAATTTNFGVVWSLQAVGVSNDDAIATNFGTAETSTDTGGTTNDIYVGPDSSAITVGGSPQPGDMVFFRVSRVPSDGSDTMAIDARLHGIELLITTNAGTDV